MIDIMVVEDEAMTLKLYEKALDPAQYAFHGFADAESALEFLKTNKVDAIISDISMPGMGGIEFFHVLKKSGRLVTPFIFITAFYKDEYEDLMDRGVDLFLVKPIEYAKLHFYLEDYKK